MSKIRALTLLTALLLTMECLSKDLNYLQSHLFRLTARNQAESWVNPYFTYFGDREVYVQANIFTTMAPDMPSFYKDITSKNRPRILNAIEKNFGRPKDLSVKAGFQANIADLSFGVSLNAGAVLFVELPQFLKFEGILFLNAAGFASYKFQFLWRKIEVEPKLIIGQRKVLDADFSVLELVDKKPNTKLKNIPYRRFAEFGLKAKYKTDYHFNAFFELNSFPIVNKDYMYWDTNLGVESHNLLKLIPLRIPFKFWNVHLGYSPVYGGNYDVSRTIRLGTSLYFFNFLGTDLFLSDDFSLGAMVKLKLWYVDATLFTFERSYDDFGLFKSRQYGLNLRVRF